MKFLFSAGVFGKMPIANNYIQLRLADALVQMGHSCIVAGISNDTVQAEYTQYGTQIRHLALNHSLGKGFSAWENYQQLNPQASKLAFCIRHPYNGMKAYAFFNDYPKDAPHRYAKLIKKIVAQENVDAVLCFVYPFPHAEAVLMQDLGDIKKIYYQLDPHGMFILVPESEYKQRRMDEAAVIAAADFTFTTRAMLREFSVQAEYVPYLQKIEAVDFPVVVPPQTQEACLLHFEKDDINVAFCGNIDNHFRDPEYFLSLLEKVLEGNPQVKMFFVGSHQGGALTQAMQKYPQNIFSHGLVTADEAASIMQHADVLLNIGNSIPNMVPSKIFAYFSTGKPVVNVQKLENSADEEYFARYPLTFTVREFARDDSPAELAGFLHKAKRQHLAYEEVEKLFYSATPQYVAKKIIDAVNNEVK